MSEVERTLTAMSRSAHPVDDVGDAYLALALQCDRPLAAPARLALHGCNEVLVGRGAERVLERDPVLPVCRVRVADARMSTTHARLRRLGPEWSVEDAGSKNGTFVNGVRLQQASLRDGDLIEVGHTFLLFRAGAHAEAVRDLGPAELERAEPGLATLLPRLATDLDALCRVAGTQVAVVLNGETGTGKEVVARALHRLSRRPGPFVAVNCGALPATLIESELFGHRKGAFSGAVEDRAGLIRSADKGTLLLDEIGDLRPPSQAALLRVLQEREVTPIGATQPVPVDFRLVAATHCDLEELVRDGEFRSDLFARVSGVTVRLPSLRERREDLGLLIATLLRRVLGERAGQIELAVEAARALFLYDWPRNVRELEKCLEAATALAAGRAVELRDLPEALRPEGGRAARAGRREPLSEEDTRKREELIALLAQHGGNVSAVARALGKQRVQIHRWLRRFAIDLGEFRSDTDRQP